MAAVFAFALLFAASAANAMDANHDGMDDGWQTRFNVAAFTGSLDPDGDGVPNLVEAINWTDPNDAASKPSSGWGYIVMFYRQFVLRPN